MENKPSRHLMAYTDESGRLGKDNLFFFGTLWCERSTARRMRSALKQVRTDLMFNDTMHFTEMSNLRGEAYVRAARAVSAIPGWSMRVLIYRKTHDSSGKPYDFTHYGQKRDPVALKRARAYNKLLPKSGVKPPALDGGYQPVGPSGPNLFPDWTGNLCGRTLVP